MSLDCFNDIDNYALTGHTSRYNEDGLTAQQLLIKCAKRVKECINVCEVLHENDYAVIESIANYNAGGEELIVGLNNLFSAKAYVNRFFFLFKENSVSQIELAGNINLAVNECLNVLTATCKMLENYDNVNLTADIVELLKLINNAYIDVFDECSMTLLELAGNTAKNINELITIINTLEKITDNIVSFYNGDSEEYVAFFKGEEDEILII